jgi:hypothetical protein
VACDLARDSGRKLPSLPWERSDFTRYAGNPGEGFRCSKQRWSLDRPGPLTRIASDDALRPLPQRERRDRASGRSTAPSLQGAMATCLGAAQRANADEAIHCQRKRRCGAARGGAWRVMLRETAAASSHLSRGRGRIARGTREIRVRAFGRIKQPWSLDGPGPLTRIASDDALRPLPQGERRIRASGNVSVRHCEERKRRSNPSPSHATLWIASRSLSSGGASRRPVGSQ